MSAVALTDADPASSLSYIDQKLDESGAKYEISYEETQLIERLGGRASDLETVGVPDLPAESALITTFERSSIK